MSRDWDAEEATLRVQATTAFEVLMGIRKVQTGASTHKAEAYARYVADDALEAYQKAKAELEAFIELRRMEDRGLRESQTMKVALKEWLAGLGLRRA